MPCIQRWGYGALTLLGLLGQLHCGDPCRDLSEKVCGCESSPQQQRLCNERVARQVAQQPAYANPQAAQASRNTCAALLEQCTCPALQADHLQACGLSVPPANQ